VPASVLVLSLAYPDHPGSNRGVFIRNLIRKTASRNRPVSVATPRVFPSSPTFETDGQVRLVRWDYGSRGKRLGEYEKTPYLLTLRLIATGVIATIVEGRRSGARLIHAHWVLPTGLIGVFASRVLNVPLIVTAHGTDVHDLPRRGAIFRLLTRFVVKKADLVISVANYMADKLVPLGSPREKTVVLGLVQCVDERRFSPDVSPSEPRADVVSTRSLAPVYDVETLVRAVAELRDRGRHVKAAIAGDGQSRRKVETLVLERGVNDLVCPVGTLPHEVLPAFLNSAPVYVSTSLFDGTSVSLLEAMACGRLPVVSDIEANREWIIHGDNGLLFPPGDHDKLADSIERGLDDKGLQMRAREINLRLIRERALWDPTLDRLEALYDELLPSHRKRTTR
jgi:glycosyltransferase involved in cell wall biosynthesis